MQGLPIPLSEQDALWLPVLMAMSWGLIKLLIKSEGTVWLKRLGQVVHQNREITTLVLMEVLTALVKVSDLAFQELGWPTLVIIALFVALGTNLAHDKYVSNRKNKPPT